MKKLYLLTSIALLFASCDNSAIKQEIVQLKNQVDSLVQVNNSQASLIASMRDSITVLSYPADQRLATINQLIKSESFDKAKKEIAKLKKVFPNSTEAASCDALLTKISDIEAKKLAEEQRIKALGFKAIQPKTTVQIDYNTVTFSGISIGSKFTFDDYGSSYFLRTAERGCKYISATMTVKSDSNYPELPECRLFMIEGDKMIRSSWFETRFASWSSYDTYLGNSHDSRNDFANTSTIRFKIGAEALESQLKKPCAIIIKNENGLRRNTEKFENPPVSYSGDINYKDTLTIDDFTSGEYFVIKFYNL